jgi:hypothetical protein
VAVEEADAAALPHYERGERADVSAHELQHGVREIGGGVAHEGVRALAPVQDDPARLDFREQPAGVNEVDHATSRWPTCPTLDRTLGNRNPLPRLTLPNLSNLPDFN